MSGELMLSHYDMVEGLTDLAKSNGFIHKEDINCMKGHVMSVNGCWFIHKMVDWAHGGNILTGFNIEAIKAQIQKLFKFSQDIGFRMKIVFNGSSNFADGSQFTQNCQIKKKLLNTLWNLELMGHFSDSEEQTADQQGRLTTIHKLKTSIFGSYLFKKYLEREIAPFIYDYLFELGIEFIVAPSTANNQLAWLYSYDYCDCVLGDLSMFPFAEILPQVLLDIDIHKKTFSYISQRDLSDSLKLIRGKDKRQLELWSFTISEDSLKEDDIHILGILDSGLKHAEDKMTKFKKIRAEKIKVALDIISSVMASIEGGPTQEKAFTEAFTNATKGQLPKREHILYRLDNGQIINSSCEFSCFPANRPYTLSEAEKKNLRNALLIEFLNCKKNYAYYCFDIFSPSFLLLMNKQQKRVIYFEPPVADSREYRSLLEAYVPGELESSLSYFLAGSSKLTYINEFMFQTYFAKEPSPLNLKENNNLFESEEKVLYYFRESAFQKYEQLLSSSGEAKKTSLKNVTSMIFHCFTTATDGSELCLTPLPLKKPVQGSTNQDLVFSKKEIIGLIFANFLDRSEYVNIKSKKFMMLGAGLMKKGSDVLEEKLVLLLELIHNNLLTGEFMNPPDMNLIKDFKKRKDRYLINSLRKTSEEIRKKGKSSISQKDEEADTAHSQNRRPSEMCLHMAEELNREPTIYDYEKCINVIGSTIQAYKDKYLGMAVKSKQISEELPIFAHGLKDKAIHNILVISRVFCFVNSDNYFKKDGSNGLLYDYETYQFLGVAGLVQNMLRLRVEGFLSSALTTGGKGLLLKEIEELKSILPFRTSYNGHLSNLMKVILTRYVIWQHSNQGASGSEFSEYMSKECSLENIFHTFPAYNNLKEALIAGYHLFMNFMKVVDYLIERGLDKQSSPFIQLWLDSREMLKDCFKKLDISDNN